MANAKPADKCYLIYITAGGRSEAHVLTKVKAQQVMGIRCITGLNSYPAHPDHWMTERIIHIPVDRIENITEYDSLDDYKEAVKRHYESKAKLPTQ